jgi:hypothetical protein
VADAVVDAVDVVARQLPAATVVADAVAKSLQHLQQEPFAARFGFLTLLPKKFQ